MVQHQPVHKTCSCQSSVLLPDVLLLLLNYRGRSGCNAVSLPAKSLHTGLQLHHWCPHDLMAVRRQQAVTKDDMILLSKLCLHVPRGMHTKAAAMNAFTRLSGVTAKDACAVTTTDM